MVMIEIVSFYKFVAISDLETMQADLLAFCKSRNLFGSILIAPEGINGSVSGEASAIAELAQYFMVNEKFSQMELKKSFHSQKPFRRMVVRLKKEIITMKSSGINPTSVTGAFIEPRRLKEWIDKREEFIFLDTRNDYEVKVGTFRGAITPNIKKFSDFPAFIDKNLDHLKGKRIVTFCTGGIRCEKATAYMIQKGLSETFQIRGGILKYFEETNEPENDNHWDGDCVVFDSRLAVNKALQPTSEILCYSCFEKLTGDDSLRVCMKCMDKQKKASDHRKEQGLMRYRHNLEKRLSLSKQNKKLTNSL
jgi:UPF0176 protein